MLSRHIRTCVLLVPVESTHGRAAHNSHSTHALRSAHNMCLAHDCLAPHFSCRLILVTQCLGRISRQNAHVSLPFADRKCARLTPHARILPHKNSSAQTEGTRDRWSSDTRERPHHGSLSRRDSLPSLRALPSFFAKPSSDPHPPCP